MIYVDISEKPYVHSAFKKRFGDLYAKKELGTWDCNLNKIPFTTFCVDEKFSKEIVEFLNIGCKYKKSKCETCENRQYKRFADFEIGEGRAFYERKTINDFVASMKSRFYHQMENMDTFIHDGYKGIILEGMGEWNFIKDGYWKEIKQEESKIKEMSPIQQAVKLAGNKGWVLSFIKECKMRGMEFVQTYSLNETMDFIEQCHKGIGEKPSLRLIPKRYPKIPLGHSILALFKGIGIARAKKIFEKDVMVSGIINALLGAMKKYKFIKEKDKNGKII